jgi:Sulfotransferase family/Tetratricopeptide repeat
MTANGDPGVLLREAAALERSGEITQAIAAYERLLSRWPDLPDSWYNLAVLQRKARRFDAALASYQQALDRGVSRPEEVHLNRGVIYADFLRRDEAAEAELRAALRLNPRYVPALLNLANLDEDLGRRDEARTLYERILAIEPDCHEALARSAGLTTVSGPDDPVIARLRLAIDRVDTTPADKASLGFALGRALDACGAYEPAFAAYTLANRHSRQSAGPRGATYDRLRHERYVDQLIGTFTGARRSAAAPAATVKPIFICGMFRSGSTLTEQVLAAHRRVAAGGEIDFLPALVRTELAPFPVSMARVTSQELDHIAVRYLDTLSRLFPGAEYVTDKRLDNFLHIGLIKTLFPDARIVHTTRDALDNCLSIYFLHLDHGMSYALDLMDIGHYYREYRRLMSHWRAKYGADILDFDYDEFVREPRPAVEKLLDFCELAWDENCLSFNVASGAVKTASVWQVRQPLYRTSSGRSRNYARQLAPLRAYLGALDPDRR